MACRTIYRALLYQAQDSQAKRARLSIKEVLPDLRKSWASFGKHLPKLDVLSDSLLTPLEEDKKIPISDETLERLINKNTAEPEHNCSRDDLLRIFRVEDIERIARETDFTSIFTLNSPSPLGTEDSFHCFWDILIRNVVAAIVPVDKLDQNRKSSVNASTLQRRPDLVVLIENLCLFRGKEKGPLNKNEDPKSELMDKLDGWVYHPLHIYLVSARMTFKFIIS